MNAIPDTEPKRERTEKSLDPRDPPLRFPERHEEDLNYRGRKLAPLPNWWREDDERGE